MRLVDVMIANMSTVWEDGVLKLDSDADGLSDELEAKLARIPTRKTAMEMESATFVERYLYRKPCNGKSC